MPLKKFTSKFIKGDEVLVKFKGAGKLQFRAAEGSPGIDIVTKSAKKAGATTGKTGITTTGKGLTFAGPNTVPVATKVNLPVTTTKGVVSQGAVGGIAKGTAGKGAVSALGAKAGTAASAKTAAIATGTIWKGTGVSLGLGLGLGAVGPVMLGGAVLGLGYYLYQEHQKGDEELDLDYEL